MRYWRYSLATTTAERIDIIIIGWNRFNGTAFHSNITIRPFNTIFDGLIICLRPNEEFSLTNFQCKTEAILIDHWFPIKRRWNAFMGLQCLMRLPILIVQLNLNWLCSLLLYICFQYPSAAALSDPRVLSKRNYWRCCDSQVDGGQPQLKIFLDDIQIPTTEERWRTLWWWTHAFPLATKRIMGNAGHLVLNDGRWSADKKKWNNHLIRTKRK